MQEVLPPERSLEVEALIRNVRGSMEKAINLGKNISPEVMAIIANLDDAGRLADLSASNLELKVEDAQSVLDIADTTARLRRVNELLNKEIEVLTVQQEINTQARADIDRSQREFYLRQQMKAIQSELGEGNELAEEIAQFREKIEAAKMPKPAEEEALRQLKKLERMHPDAAETATLRNWMEIMTDLPWSKSSNDNLDLLKAERILERRSLRSRKGERAHHRSARRAQAEGETERTDPLSGRTAGRRQDVAWVVRSRALSTASSCACRWAACTTKLKFAAIAEPTSARCPAASFRRFSRPALTIR